MSTSSEAGLGPLHQALPRARHPAGTLVETVCEAPLRITLVEFTDEAFEERVISSPADCVSPEECREYLASPSKTWIHVQGCVTPDTLRQLGEMFGLHVLALEDVLNTGQRTKLEDYDSQLFLVMHLPLRTDAGLVAEQISLFLGPNYLISLHASPPRTGRRARPPAGGSPARRGCRRSARRPPGWGVPRR